MAGPPDGGHRSGQSWLESASPVSAVLDVPRNPIIEEYTLEFRSPGNRPPAGTRLKGFRDVRGY